MSGPPLSYLHTVGTYTVIKQQLLNRIADKSAVIGIVGLGYVGLPLMLRFAEVGYKVLGFDIDQGKVDTLMAGQSYIEHISADSIATALERGFEATTDFSRVPEADTLILCVPTPLNKYREPDLSFVLDTMDSLVPYLREGQLVSLESTTYPGTTDEELLPRMESRGLKVGDNAFLVFSPEREDPGNPNFTTRTIPKVCGGVTPACQEIGVALYSAVIDKVVPVSSTRAAEMTKLLENIHRAVNIGLVNEMKIVADKMGIDIHEVIRAAATKPFGFVPYYPGPGLGGHCIPIDPFYLTWKAREYGVNTRFIELAGEVNSNMPDYVVSKVAAALNQRKKAINGSRVLVLGIAYKKNVDDMRESPSVFLMEKLRDLGAEVAYSDPHVPVFPKMREHRFELSSVALSNEAISGYDCVLLATDHDKFDYAQIKAHAQLVVDSRGKYLEPAANIVKA
nr:nucleotide sugar dehydrogenase [Chromobacterium aquaticum]